MIFKNYVAEMPADVGAGIVPHIFRLINHSMFVVVYICERGLSETIKKDIFLYI